MVEPYKPPPFGGGREPLAQGPAIPAMRTFDTGATRNTDVTKLDYEGFLSPYVSSQVCRVHAYPPQAGDGPPLC
jgi:hypothetical protein